MTPLQLSQVCSLLYRLSKGASAAPLEKPGGIHPVNLQHYNSSGTLRSGLERQASSSSLSLDAGVTSLGVSGAHDAYYNLTRASPLEQQYFAASEKTLMQGLAVLGLALGRLQTNPAGAANGRSTPSIANGGTISGTPSRTLSPTHSASSDSMSPPPMPMSPTGRSLPAPMASRSASNQSMSASWTGPNANDVNSSPSRPRAASRGGDSVSALPRGRSNSNSGFELFDANGNFNFNIPTRNPSASVALPRSSSPSISSPAPPPGPQEQIVLYHRGKALSLAQVEQAMMDLDKIFQVKEVFDFGTIVHRMVKGCVEVLLDMCPYLLPHRTALEQIQVKRTHPSGEEFMVPYEISFQTNMAVGEIAYPDPYKLPVSHLKAMMTRFGRAHKGRFFQRFVRSCYSIPCHEIIHCVQHVLKQIDTSPAAWSAEHDASYVNHSLFWAVSKLPHFKDMFPPGFAEEIVSEGREYARACWSAWDPKVREEYKKWRDAFGLKPPAGFVTANPAIDGQFKSVLASEFFYADSACLQQQLDLIFKNRTGPVHAVFIHIPPTLARKRMFV